MPSQLLSFHTSNLPFYEIIGIMFAKASKQQHTLKQLFCVIYVTGTFKIIHKICWKWNICGSLLFIL